MKDSPINHPEFLEYSWGVQCKQLLGVVVEKRPRVT